jgi:hypothetical protein
MGKQMPLPASLGSNYVQRMSRMCQRQRTPPSSKPRSAYFSAPIASTWISFSGK